MYCYVLLPQEGINKPSERDKPTSKSAGAAAAAIRSGVRQSFILILLTFMLWLLPQGLEYAILVIIMHYVLLPEGAVCAIFIHCVLFIPLWRLQLPQEAEYAILVIII